MPSVFRERNLLDDTGVNELFEMLPNRRLTLAWIHVVEFFQRRQLRGVAKNVLEECESRLLGNDVEPIPDGFDLIWRVIGRIHYPVVRVARAKAFHLNTNRA